MFKQIIPAIRATLVLAVLTGLLFPFLVTALAQIFFPFQANGSLIKTSRGEIVGSKLIGQPFTRAGYFHCRPSATGFGCSSVASGGTNLGPTSAKLILGDKNASFSGIKQLAEQYRQENKLPLNCQIPVDAVTYSGSGLDPHISLTNAILQSGRVASYRNLSVTQIHNLIKKYTEPKQLGILGEHKVNVLMLNLALDAQK